jgi:hypothetical protein
MILLMNTVHSLNSAMQTGDSHCWTVQSFSFIMSFCVSDVTVLAQRSIHLPQADNVDNVDKLFTQLGSTLSGT